MVMQRTLISMKFLEMVMDYKMKYYANVVSLSDEIEEEVLLSFGDRELYCFISESPYALIEGELYLVELSLTFLDDECLNMAIEKKFIIDRINKSFAYRMTGVISDGKLITDGFVFQDEIFSHEYAYLESDFVSLTSDRISVSFI